MLRWIYTALVYCLLPLALLKLLWQGRKNKAYRHHWNERFGFVHPAPAVPIIWVHAVSVGETIAIHPLIEALLKKYPTHKIWLTNGTINGRKRTEALFGDRVFCSYAPYDTPSIIQRFLKRANPRLVLIMETEVWINWMHALTQKNIPVLLVNARLSEKSYQRYHRFIKFFQNAWQSFAMIAAQSSQDASRFKQLGVAPKRIQVVGNLKYNLILSPHLSEQVQVWQGHIPHSKIWVTASTHHNEEEQLLPIFAALKRQEKNSLWVLIPRHPERVQAVKALCEAQGWTVQPRSQCGKVPSAIISSDILLVDTMGELLLFYALAQVVFVGGSLIEKGGHNILEAAAVGATITCGPSMFNFAVVLEQFKKAHAIIQCQHIAELTQQTLKLFEDQTTREKMSAAAKACFEADQAALPKHVALIEKFL